MADQVVDPIAAKYGGAAVAAPEPELDPIAKKYGGAIDPVAAKYGALPIDPATGRPAPIQVDRQFTSNATVTEPRSPNRLIGQVPNTVAPAEAPNGLAEGLLEHLVKAPIAGAVQAGRGALSLFDLAKQTVVDAVQHPPVVSAEPHVVPNTGADTHAAMTAVTAGNNILEGGFQALSPLVYAAAVANPVSTAAALAGAYAGSKVVQTGASALGAPEPVSRFAGNLAALLAGSLAAHASTKGTFGTERTVADKVATDAQAADVAAAARKAATDALGVPVDADPETIKSAYRAAARANHPDVGGDPSRMTDLNLAYEWLEDHPAPAVDRAPTVTLSGWIAEQAAWLRSKFRSRMADAADRAANPPPPSSEGRALTGAVDPAAAKFGGQPVEPPVTSSAPPTAIAPETTATATPAVTLAVRVGDNPNVQAVDSLEHAQQIHNELRDRAEAELGPGAAGASHMPPVSVVNTTTGETVAHISYNGRVTDPSGQELVPQGAAAAAPEDPVAQKFGGMKVAAARSPEGSGQGDLLAAPATKTSPKYSVLSTLDAAQREALFSALGGFQGGNERWNELRLRGATDKQILEQAGQEFGISGSASIGAGHDHKGGKNPQVILGTSRGGLRLKLQGPKLAATIREAMGIPAPVQTIAGKPIAPERPISFWELNPDELQARIGFDITKPWETGPSAHSTPEQLEAFHDKLIDNVLATVEKKGYDALPEVTKLLRSVEHLRDHSDPSDWGYAWDVEPFVRTIPELDRITKMLEGQRDLPITRPGAAPVKAALPKSLESTRTYADVEKWVADEAERSGQTTDQVLEQYGLPESPDAFERWIYPAKVGTPVPGEGIKKIPETAAAENPEDLGFKAGDEVHFKDGGRPTVGTINQIITAGKKGGKGIKAQRRRAELSFTTADGQKMATHRDLDEITKVAGSAKSAEPPKADWQKREDAIAAAVKASKASGAVHLDQLPLGVEALRGRRFKSLRDGQEWVATTVDNRGVVYFVGADGEGHEQISGKELGEFVRMSARLSDLALAIKDNTGKAPSAKQLEESAGRYGMSDAAKPVDVKAIQRAWSNRERPPQTETALASAVPDGQSEAFYRTLAAHYAALEQRTRPLASPSFDGDRMNRIADQWKAAADRAKLHFENAVSENAPAKPDASTERHDAEAARLAGRADLIERIVAAARKPTPDVVEQIEALATDGKFYRTHANSLPSGVQYVDPPQRRSTGFVQQTPQGIRVGRGYKTKEALLEDWRRQEDASAADFRKHLEDESDERLASQARHWLKGAAEDLLAKAAIKVEKPIPEKFQTKTHTYRRNAKGKIDIYKRNKRGDREVYETTVEADSYAIPGEYREQLGTRKPLTKPGDEVTLTAPAGPQAPSFKVGDRVVSWQGTGAIHSIQGTDARIYREDKNNELSKWMPLKDLKAAPSAAEAAPKQLTDGERRSGEKKLKALERRYGIQSTKFSSQVRNAATAQELAFALESAEHYFKEHEAKQERETQKTAAKLADAQEKATQKGRDLLAAGKKFVWRVTGFGKGQEFWEPMEGGGPVDVKGAPAGVTFSAFKENGKDVTRKGWLVVEDSTGRSIAGKVSGTKAAAVTAAEDMIKSLKPGQWDKAMAAAAKNAPPKPDLAAPVDVDPIATKHGGTKLANPESRYAGDDLDNLLLTTEDEQAQRFEQMLAIEKALETLEESTSAKVPGQAKKVEDVKRQLKELSTVYQGTYSEIADAAGDAAMNEMQDRVEKGRVSLADEILNPPKRKGEPANEEERIAAREAAAKKKAEKHKPAPGISVDQMTEAELKAAGTDEARAEIKARKWITARVEDGFTENEAKNAIAAAKKRGLDATEFDDLHDLERKLDEEDLELADAGIPLPVDRDVDTDELLPPVEEPEVGTERKKTLATKAFDVLLDALQRKGIAEPFPKGAVEFRKWMAEQLDVPVDLLVEGIDVINDAAEAALAAHLRKDADADSLELALNQAENYEALLPRAHRTLEKSKLQQFSTPLPIGLLAGEAADLRDGDRVLEPTAGTGSLLVGVPDDIQVTAVEIAPRRVELLRAAGVKNTFQADYLGQALNKAFTVIITNPPWGKYSTGKYGKGVAIGFGPTDVAERFVGKNMRDLAEGGRLVAVMPTTMHNAASFKAWLKYHYTVQAIIQAPPGAYDTRSTGVDSVLLVVDKVKPAAGAAWPKTVTTADWDEYREAVAAIPERTHEPEALTTGGRPTETPRSDSGRGTGSVSRPPAAGGRPARPEPRPDAPVAPGRPPDLVAGGKPAGGAPAKPAGEFTARVSGPSSDARAKAARSESFAPYTRRTALRGAGHPKLVVEARQLAGVDYPALTIAPGPATTAALADGRLSVEQAEQALAAVQANIVRHHGYLAADAVGVGKSREIALTVLEAMERAKADGRELRLVLLTKSSDNIADLVNRELYYVATGRTKDGTDLANPGAEKLPGQGLPFAVEFVEDRKGAKKHGTNEYEPLPVHKHGVYVVSSFGLAPYEGALEDIGAHGVVGDEAHRFKNIEGAAVGGAWQRLHALIMRDVPRPEQFFAYFTATPAQQVEDYAYLYGLRLWPVDGFGNWLNLVTGSLSEAEAAKLQADTEKGAIDSERVLGNDGGVVGGDGENTTGAKKKGGGITNRSAFDARLTPTEGEQIPREWKMLGRFSARDLWRDGTEFQIHEAKLSTAHATKYDQFVTLAQDIIETAAKYGTMDKSGRSSRFGVTGLLQFAAKRIQMQPAIEEAIKIAQAEVATGHQAVISLINVSEMNDERGHLQAAIDKINTRIVDVDPDDPDGGLVDQGEIPEAIIDQARLRDAVRDLGTFDDPVKMVEDAVGKENVALITGETAATRQSQVADFQAGKRDYAVLSAAGSTGINLDHRVFTDKQPARGRRVFIDVQYEWSATESLQRYGRVDRASSITPPKIKALTFGSAAEKKFLATIANRMAALGALSKGGAESTGGASALEEFEITGDDALAAARKAYEELDREGKRQFARIKSVFRDPNRETKPDRIGYDPYAPKPTASGTTMQDFQLPLLFMPMAQSNAFWKRFIELRDEIREASGQNRASRTERFKGEILETAQLKDHLTLYTVKNEARQKFGILAGLVTQELPKIRQALKGGDYDQTTGRYESKFTRRYVTFTAGDQTVTGLQIKWTEVPQVAALYDHHTKGETLDTPAKVLEALKNGEKIALQEKNPDSNKPWTLRMRQDGKILIDNARMVDRALLLRHGADYAPVGNFWHVKPSEFDRFLERFPIAEASTTKPPSPSSGGGTTLQATVLPGAAEFFEQDVLPGLKGTGEAFAQAAAQLKRAVAPASVGRGAEAAGTLRAMMAREAQENARMMKAAEAFQTQFDKLLATPGGRDQAIDWWDAVQLGKPTTILPELKAAYDYMRQALDEERIEIQKFGKLEDFNEFYFPQIWKFPKQEETWIRRKIAGLMGKRPFEGSKGFLKQRKYPTFREGLAALTPKGVEPISYNPVDHFLVKMREMRRYRVARAAIKDFEALGIWKAFRGVGVKPPAGWTRIEGPLGTIYGRPTVSFKEAFDPDLMEGLEKFARSLGVRLDRQPNIGGKRWGYAQGDTYIMTKAGGPETVLMHEIGHILDERYHIRGGMVNDKKFRQELRDLADLRHEGIDTDKLPPSRLRYERKGEEKIANLVHAFIYAPERAKKIAPNSYWALYNLTKKHAELRPLVKLQKTRTLKLGSVRTHQIDIGGFPETGFYAMPDDAARIFNNHLSRGLAGQSAIYDAYRWLNNTMVTGQLAASGLFHATFTGLNALASEGGLALQELTLAAQTGDWSLAGKGAKRLAVAGALGTAGAAAGFAIGGPAGLLWATGYPLAGLKFVKGWRAQKEWITKDPAGRFFADHVRQMQEGGFRPTWDQFYDNGAMKNALRALKSGNYPGALARTIPAALDAVSTPIMRWLVPAVKTAAYLDAASLELGRLAQHVAGVEDAERELANLPQSPRHRALLSPEQRRVIVALESQRADNLAVIREALNKVQASIDNRFGEVVYDNWFWKRWLKDLTHITFRSPGWQFGTYKEVGGAVTSQAGILGRRIQDARAGGREKGADPEALLSGQMAWLLAMIGMTMLMGGMEHYLATGERPHGRDWTNPKGPDGKRRALPTYLRTITSAWLHPMRTVGSITAPLNTMLYRLLVSNETYSGETIREPGDPFLKQAWSALRMVASEGYQPFVASNIARGQSSLESTMGVAPAPAELQRSDAENYLHDVLPPSPPRTHEQQEHLEATRNLRSAVQQKNLPAAAKAVQDGGLSRRSIMAGVRNASRDSLVRAFERATLDQAIHAYELATPEERLELRVPLVQKWHRLFPAEPPKEKAAIAARFSAAFKLPVARPTAAAAR